MKKRFTEEQIVAMLMREAESGGKTVAHSSPANAWRLGADHLWLARQQVRRHGAGGGPGAA